MSRVLGNGHALVLRGARHSNVSGLPVQSSTLRASLCYGVPHLLKHRKGPRAMAAIVIADLKMIALTSGYGSG